MNVIFRTVIFICLNIYFFQLSGQAIEPLKRKQIVINNNENNSIQDYREVLQGNLYYSGLEWELFYKFKKNEHSPKQPSDMIKSVLDFIKFEEEHDKKSANSIFLKNNIEKIKIITENIQTYVPDKIGFYYMGLPLSICSKGADTVLVFNSLLTFNTLNTLKLNKYERASLILKTLILPSLKVFSKVNFQNGIKFYCINAIFFSKSFIEDNDDEMRKENMALLIPVNTCKSFNESEISEQEMMKYCEVFMRDRDNEKIFRKIDVKLD